MNIRRARHSVIALILVFAAFVGVLAVLSNRWTTFSIYENVVDLDEGWSMVTPSPTAQKGAIAVERVFSVGELQSTGGGPTICFRTNNATVVVRVNGSYMYSYGLLGKKRIGNETGTCLHFFRLSHFYPNAQFTVNIEFAPMYQPSEKSFFKRGTQLLVTPHIYFGSKAACIQQYIADTLLSATVSIIIIFIGLMYLVLTGTFWISHRQYTRDFCYWGIFSLITGIGYFFESGLADLFVPNAFLRYFCSTLVLAILPDFFLMYVKTSKLLPYHSRLCNFFIVQSLVNSFLVCGCALIPALPFSYVRMYIIISHMIYLFFVIAMFINNSIGLSRRLSLTELFVILTSVIMLVDFTLYLVPPYQTDLFMFCRFCMLVYLVLRTVEIINDFYCTQILSAREEMYRSVVVKDSLTGVFTRPSFWQRQKDLFAQNQSLDGRLSLLICELVNVKEINEKFGYEEGDEALKTVSQILKLNFSQENVFRLDGSCFGVLLLDMSEDTVRTRLEEMQEIITDYNNSQSTGMIRLCMENNVYYSHQAGSFDEFLTNTMQKLGEKRNAILHTIS